MIIAAVAKHLASLNLVTYGQAGADCFLEPPHGLVGTPVDIVALFGHGGGQARLDDIGVAGFSIQLRSSDPDGVGRARAGHDRIMGIKNALHGLTGTVLDPGGPDEVTLISCLANTDDPVQLATDEEDFPRWGLSFRVQYHAVDGVRRP